jgi:hypothetical protein
MENRVRVPAGTSRPSRHYDFADGVRGKIDAPLCAGNECRGARRTAPAGSIVSRQLPLRSTATSRRNRPCRSSRSLHSLVPNRLNLRASAYVGRPRDLHCHARGNVTDHGNNIVTIHRTSFLD